MLLAESVVSDMYVHKEDEKDPQTIVSIIQHPKFKKGEYTVSLESEYIEVYVSDELNSRIKSITGTTSGWLIQKNILYIPVITYALTNLQDKRVDFIGYKWAQVLDNCLRKRSDATKDPNSLRSEPHNQAQDLLKTPILTQFEKAD